MRFSFFLLNIFFIIQYNYYFIQQYYSPYRLYSGIKTMLLELKYKSILIGLFLLSILFLNTFLFFLINLFVQIIILIQIPRVHFKLKKRGIIQLVTTLILFSIIYIIVDYKVLIFPLINSYLFLVISFVFLLPYKLIEKNYFIRKAKRKLDKSACKIILITGSYSKTTMKTYLHQCLSVKYNVCCPKKNTNTLMGICKYINDDFDANCDYLILELGIDKKHGLRKFKRLLKADYGIITGVGKVHLATFFNIYNILISKTELELLLKDQNAKLFVNGEDSLLKTYQFHEEVIYYKNKITFNDKKSVYQNLCLNCIYIISKLIGIKDKEFSFFLSNLKEEKNHYEVINIENDIYINDTYNINYFGFKQGIEKIFEYNKYKIVITGGLIEQGKEFKQNNKLLNDLCNKIDLVILITKRNNHPFYEQGLFNKQNIIVVKNYKKALKIVDSITESKVVYLTSKGSDFYLE